MFGVVSKKTYEALRQKLNLTEENLNQKTSELTKSTSQSKNMEASAIKLNSEIVNLKLQLEIANKTLKAKDVSFTSQAQLDLSFSKNRAK